MIWWKLMPEIRMHMMMPKCDKASAREEKGGGPHFGLLPEDQESELRELWEEFEAYETPEALFAHCLTISAIDF